MESVAAGAVLLILAVASMLIPVALAVVALSAIRQAKLRRRATAVSPLVAEAMTRSTIANAHAVFVTGFLLSAALYFTGDEDYALLVAYVPVTRVLRLWIAHRFLHYIETHVGPVTLHGNLLAVHCDRYIVVPRSIVRGALRHAVPFAGLKDRR